MARRSVAEVATGLAVLAAAGGFLAYALAHTGHSGGSGTRLVARFENIGTLTAGSDVRIGGVTVGRVNSLEIDPTSFQAVVRFTVQPHLKLPADTSATISSSGLLGTPVLSLSPGGDDTILQDGGTMRITQGATNLEDLLGKFIFNVGSLADSNTKMLKQMSPDSAGGGSGSSKP